MPHVLGQTHMFNVMDDGERYDTTCCEVAVPIPTPLWCLGATSGVFLLIRTSSSTRSPY